MWFKKIFIIPGRRGVSKTEKFKAMYEAKLEFLGGGGGVMGQIPSVGGGGEIWIFSGTTQ